VKAILSGLMNGDIISFRDTSGATIIGIFMKVLDDSVVIERPVSCQLVPGPQGVGLTMVTYPLTLKKDNHVSINLSQIVLIITQDQMHEQMLADYKRTVGLATVDLISSRIIHPGGN